MVVYHHAWLRNLMIIHVWLSSPYLSLSITQDCLAKSYALELEEMIRRLRTLVALAECSVSNTHVLACGHPFPKWYFHHGVSCVTVWSQSEFLLLWWNTMSKSKLGKKGLVTLTRPYKSSSMKTVVVRAKTGRNLKAVADSEAIKEWCLLACSLWLIKPFRTIGSGMVSPKLGWLSPITN